jgi:hypothetical protein
MRNEVMQKIGDRIVSDDDLNEDSVVQIYDEDMFGQTVTFIVVRRDEDPGFGINSGFDDPHCEPIDSSYFIKSVCSEMAAYHECSGPALER